MATNQRRRERYQEDETYRERRKRQAKEYRESKRMEARRIERQRGWEPIATAPDNEVILLYDPHIFWPITARLRNHEWECINYAGPDPRPTHWRYPLKVPLE